MLVAVVGQRAKSHYARLSRCMLSNSVILLRHRSSACTLVHVWRYQVILFSLCINTSVVALRYQSSQFICISLLPNASFIQKRKPQKKYGGRQKVHHSTRFTQHNHYIQPQQHASPREEAIPGENQRESRSNFQGEWPVHCAKQGFRL